MSKIGRQIIQGLKEALRHARGQTAARVASPGHQSRQMTRFVKCPHCGSPSFYDGPSGGLSQNVFCTDCEAGFNVFLMPGGPYLDMEIRPPNQDKLTLSKAR